MSVDLKQRVARVCIAAAEDFVDDSLAGRKAPLEQNYGPVKCRVVPNQNASTALVHAQRQAAAGEYTEWVLLYMGPDDTTLLQLPWQARV